MLKIIKTNDGYMVEKEDGDYLCDANGDNLWDWYHEAEAVMNGEVKPSNWAKANTAFYAWEKLHHEDDSDLSDDDRMLWVEGYLQALRDAK